MLNPMDPLNNNSVKLEGSSNSTIVENFCSYLELFSKNAPGCDGCGRVVS